MSKTKTGHLTRVGRLIHEYQHQAATQSPADLITSAVMVPLLEHGYVILDRLFDDGDLNRQLPAGVGPAPVEVQAITICPVQLRAILDKAAYRQADGIIHLFDNGDTLTAVLQLDTDRAAMLYSCESLSSSFNTPNPLPDVLTILPGADDPANDPPADQHDSEPHADSAPPGRLLIRRFRGACKRLWQILA